MNISGITSCRPARRNMDLHFSLLTIGTETWNKGVLLIVVSLLSFLCWCSIKKGSRSAVTKILIRECKNSLKSSDFQTFYHNLKRHLTIFFIQVQIDKKWRKNLEKNKWPLMMTLMAISCVKNNSKWSSKQKKNLFMHCDKYLRHLCTHVLQNAGELTTFT